ncbi:MAG: UDP-3-O-(3-hydroxymyristoyl)glucosamine N-acyltransferase [Rhodospirillales bacterium]
MADPRFFEKAGPYKAARLAELIGAEIVSGSPDTLFDDVAALKLAGRNAVSFLDNPKYVDDFRTTRAGGCIIHPDRAGDAPDGCTLLVSADPYRAYAKAAAAFYPETAGPPDISAAAIIDPTARIGEGCVIRPGAVIGAGVIIGPQCFVGANSVIETGVEIGAECHIAANVTISHALIGNRVRLLPGVRIGQDGFGYAMGAAGHLRVPQLGRVLIEDGVEIGSNSCVDRGAGPDTVIGAGTIIDNLVQVAHNVVTGPGCVIVSHVGISGSTELGRGVVLGGQVGIAGHLKIGDGARVAAQSGIMHDIPAGEEWFGSPAQPKKEAIRQLIWVKRNSGRGRS